MAIRKTGSRLIMVDGASYRWRIRHRVKDDLCVAIELAERSHRVLIVCAGLRGHTAPPSVTPSMVADFIRQALSAGWSPGGDGSPFVLNLALETG